MTTDHSEKTLTAARALVADLAEALDMNASVRLWNGETLPLGQNVSGPLVVTISEPGVIASILKRPSLDRVIQHYAHGQLGFEGGTLVDLGEALGDGSSRRKVKRMAKGPLLRKLTPFLMTKSTRPQRTRDYDGDAEGAGRDHAEDKKFIQFHYDVSNAFYELFLDERMVYTCAYFTDWQNGIDQAQFDKLDMTCRKLRLKPGEKMLDIGCGWGSLICHAAQYYGVKAHGVTLSQEQYDYTVERIEREGLKGRVTIALQDYRDLTETFDKISSIGMYEAIGVPAIPAYMEKIRSLLNPGGLFLNHGITRRSKKKKTKFTSRAEQRALVKYIFPGGELDDIGNTIQTMEQAGFEVHDVEGWREHYARTTRLWCERLTEHKEEAVAIVGEETWRIWVAYLGGCSLAFTRGSARIYQTLAGYSARGASPLPPTREDLYE